MKRRHCVGVMSAMISFLIGISMQATDYFVNPQDTKASDENPGTEAAPWKTLLRTTTAKELKIGDKVYIKSIFRDMMTLKVGGDPGKPLFLEWVPFPYAPLDPKFKESVNVTPDVAYGYKDGMAMTFDVLKPKNANGAGILIIQSGMWCSNHGNGSGDRGVEYWQWLMSKGFTLFMVYHPDGSKYLLPEIVESMQRSVRFIRANAKRFGVDPDRLGAWGASSGGHLALMLATTDDDGNPKSEDPILRVGDRLAAVVAFFPPTDIRPWFNTGKWKEYQAFRFDPASAGYYSPITHVSDKTSPMLLIHGDKDPGIPIEEHSEKMYAELQKNHVPSELFVVRGGGHGFSGMGVSEWSAGIARDIWFEKYLLPNKQ